MYVDSAVHIQYSPATYEASRVEWDPGPLIVTGWSGERPRQGGSQACGEVLGSHFKCCPWHSTGLMCARSPFLLTLPVSPLLHWKWRSFDSCVWITPMAVWGKRVCALLICASLISGVCELLYIRPVIYRQGGDVKRMCAHLLTYGLEVTVLHVGLISKAAALGINLECGLSGGWRAAQPFWVVGSTAWPATWVSADPSVNHNSGGIKAGANPATLLKIMRAKGEVCSMPLKNNFWFSVKLKSTF